MDFVIVGFILQATDGLLPIGGQDVTIIAIQALTDLIAS